jgi:hypothetical protein
MDTKHSVDCDDNFQTIRQDVFEAIYGKDIRVILAVLREAVIVSMAQCSPEARWDIAKNFNVMLRGS